MSRQQGLIRYGVWLCGALAFSLGCILLAIGASSVALIYATSGADTVAAAEPRAFQKLRYKLKSEDWKAGEKRKQLVSTKAGFAFLSGLAGNFAGRGESVEVQATKEGVWVLEGQAQQFLAARATAVTELTPALFIPRPQRYEWSQGQARVKMLHRSEGVCLLAGLSGALRGYGEKLRVSLADDGYWYLEGTSGQGDLSGVAVGLKWAKPGTFTCSATTKTWSTGQEPVSMGKPGEGLCVLSGISGCMLGGGEGVEVIVDNDTWILRGNSQQEELQFEATFIQVEPVAK